MNDIAMRCYIDSPDNAKLMLDCIIKAQDASGSSVAAIIGVVCLFLVASLAVVCLFLTR